MHKSFLQHCSVENLQNQSKIFILFISIKSYNILIQLNIYNSRYNNEFNYLKLCEIKM